MAQINVVDVIMHPGFVDSVKNQLTGVKKSREKAIEAFKKDLVTYVMLGELHFKRNATDTLEDKGISTANKYRESYLDILRKKSTLSSRERDFIGRICNAALYETIKKYFNHSIPEKNNNPTTKL